MRIGSQLGREELAAEARLLLLSLVREREQNRIEEIRIDAGRLPACVEVARHVLRSDEAPIDVGTRASCVAKTVQRRAEAFKQFSTPVSGAVPVDDLLPSRFMDSFRQIPALEEGRDGHNTMILLCWPERKLEIVRLTQAAEQVADGARSDIRLSKGMRVGVIESKVSLRQALRKALFLLSGRSVRDH